MSTTEPLPSIDGVGASVDLSKEIAPIIDALFGSAGDDKADVQPYVETFIEEILSGNAPVGNDLEAALGARIADIDDLLSDQVNQVIHDPEFQALEASWRGLDYLVSGCEGDELLRVRILDASKDDLLNDMERSPEFDLSSLFVKVYEEEYGILGGDPFGMLVGDFEFDHHPQDSALLRHISSVAAAAHAPFIAAASPEMFGMDSLTALNRPRDLTKLFSSTEYISWRAFRDSEDSRYIALVLPRILLREPYGYDTCEVPSFRFDEQVDGTSPHNYLFGNSAFALARCVAESFEEFHWCAAIRGTESGGLVNDLPAPSFGTDRPGLIVRGPTETDLTEQREKDLADLGFIPLVHCKGTGDAVFFSTQTCQKSRSYDTEEANANARLSTQLQYMLSTSRFAHYLKVIMRDKTGSLASAQECERLLNDWITKYCLGNPENAGDDERARRPLSDASIEVREMRGKPGTYEAVVRLLPHFLLEELGVSLRLVTELPSSLQT